VVIDEVVFYAGCGNIIFIDADSCFFSSVAERKH
jgi:hypothetical protein